MEITARIKGAVGLIVVLILYLGLVPTVVDQTQNVNTTGWSFTGYAGAIILLGVIPFIFIASILLLVISEALS